MATKQKTTKRGKKLTSAKELGKVKPLTKYMTVKLTDVQISSIQPSGGGGGTSN
jgi:type VI protein secretion system component Hcp